ncbi:MULTISPECIES: 3-deoxy-7-phosphoheptulonate synthase [unclassified Streptomyces]|uniref:3-deoxy-7-phosphoheptulonate synthase n=1 Tax=unclassified Streptomyces TaxID=2593676 RepID=UPI002965D98E|nr:3-deoxy-7-phosphoheptulonate synthase [Streptomyces sp. SJL17-1]
MTTLLPLPVEDLAAAFADEDCGPAHAVRERLRAAPPLVARAETELLSVRLAAVARGEAFLLQGGDSTRPAAGDPQVHLEANLRVLHQTGVALMYATGLPVVKTAQVCGPYARPHGLADDGIARDHALSAPIMNLFRGLCRGESPSLDRIHRWNTEFVRTAAGARHRVLADRIGRGLRFMEAGGFTDHTARTAEVYTSRRMVAPDDERAMMRPDTEADRPAGRDTSTPRPMGQDAAPAGPATSMVSGSAHFLWLDARTARADASYTDLVRRVSNPVGLRIGPDTTAAHVADLVERLDPRADPGRLTLTCAMGGGRVRDLLPSIVERVEATGRQVVWQCDPVHRNPGEFEGALDEVAGFIEVHRRLGTHPGGLRVETAGSRESAGSCESAAGARLTGSHAVELGFHTAELLGT